MQRFNSVMADISCLQAWMKRSYISGVIKIVADVPAPVKLEKLQVSDVDVHGEFGEASTGVVSTL